MLKYFYEERFWISSSKWMNETNCYTISYSLLNMTSIRVMVTPLYLENICSKNDFVHWKRNIFARIALKKPLTEITVVHVQNKKKYLCVFFHQPIWRETKTIALFHFFLSPKMFEMSNYYENCKLNLKMKKLKKIEFYMSAIRRHIHKTLLVWSVFFLFSVCIMISNVGSRLFSSCHSSCLGPNSFFVF